MENSTKKWYLTWDGKNKFMIALLLLLPLITSIISTWHVIDFMGLANHRIMAITLAGTFEAGLLAALASMQIMRIIESKWAIYLIFVLLTFYQLIGNIYYGYNYITINIEKNPLWINNFVELFQFVYDPEDILGWKRIIAITAGAILPIVSMIFLHLVMEYILAKPKILEEKSTILQPEIKNNVSTEKIEETSSKEEVIQKEVPAEVIPVVENPMETPKEDVVHEETIVEVPKEEVESTDSEELLSPEVVSGDMVYATLNQTPLSEGEIEQFKQNKEENKETIKEIKEELDKNVEENLYIRLLTALYKNGIVKPGDFIPKWEILLQDIKKSEISVTDKEIKQFLVLCTVLKIIDMNDQNHRVFKKSFEKAKEIINLLA